MKNSEKLQYINQALKMDRDYLMNNLRTILKDLDELIILHKELEQNTFYKVHLPDGTFFPTTAQRINNIVNSDKALQYQDCQIRITVERNINK